MVVIVVGSYFNFHVENKRNLRINFDMNFSNSSNSTNNLLAMFLMTHLWFPASTVLDIQSLMERPVTINGHLIFTCNNMLLTINIAHRCLLIASCILMFFYCEESAGKPVQCLHNALCA